MAVTFDDIQDPGAGLERLSDCPDVHEQDRQRWTFVFTEWRDGVAGDTFGFLRALHVCTTYLREPPPNGLVNDLIARVASQMSKEEQQDHAALARHKARWGVMEAALAEGRSYESAREAASARLAGSGAAGEPRTVRESHELINDAGGKRASLTSYRQARQRRNSTPK